MCIICVAKNVSVEIKLKGIETSTSTMEAVVIGHLKDTKKVSITRAGRLQECFSSVAKD